MPRYINADELKATITANAWSNPAVPAVVNKIIDVMPTVDVVPRAEVEQLTHLRRKNKKDVVADVPIQLSIFDKEDKNDKKENQNEKNNL